MRIRKANRLPLIAATCGTLMVCQGAFALEEEGTGLVRHFIDTSTDRVPALTAFPKYPSVARRDRIQGEATVCFKIRANGRISRPKVTEYSHRIFSKPSLRAIKKSTFEPLGPGQILKTSRTCRTYRFRLEPVLAENAETDATAVEDAASVISVSQRQHSFRGFPNVAADADQAALMPGHPRNASLFRTVVSLNSRENSCAICGVP